MSARGLKTKAMHSQYKTECNGSFVIPSNAYANPKPDETVELRDAEKQVTLTEVSPQGSNPHKGSLHKHLAHNTYNNLCCGKRTWLF